MVISDKGVQKKAANIRTITSGDLTWVDVVQPTKDSMKYLADHYNFHPMDLEDALSTRQLSKIEEYPQYLFVIFHFQVFEKATRVSSRKQWSAFVGDKFLVTLHPEEIRTIEEIFRECENSKESQQEHLSNGAGYLLYQILDRAVDSYFPVMDKILSQMDSVEDSVFNEEVEVAQEVSILRRDIITQRRVMFPIRTLVVELGSKLKRFTKMDLTIYLSDLTDHLNKICETLDEITEVIEVFKDADFLMSSYRANRGIRLVSVMFIAGLPPLIVFGTYGAYAMVRGGVEKGSPQIFFLLLAAVLIIIGAMLYFFRRKHLI